MEFVFDDGRTERDLTAEVSRPDATVADLAEALGADRGPLLVDGRDVGPDLGLNECGLVVGSVVTASAGPETTAEPPLPPPTPTPPAAAVLRVVGGLNAGASIPLPTGASVLGRAGHAAVSFTAPDVSREHCRIEVSVGGSARVTDLGSRNGTDVDGARLDGEAPAGPDAVLTLGGAVAVQIVPTHRLGPVLAVDPRREARPGGRLPFNRAPRPPGPPVRARLRAPTPPMRAHKTPFSIATLLGPIIMAVAMVWLTHDLSYGLIAGLTPLMFLGNFVEDRTQGRRSLRRSTREYHAALETLRAELRARHAEEISLRRNQLCDPAELAWRAMTPGVRLWERRPGAPDFLRASAGFATLPWELPVEVDGPSEERLRRLLEEFATLPAVPVPVEVGAGEVLGLAGDRASALAVARSVLCQAVTASGPADVTVAVFVDGDRLTDWEWVKWLPHVRDRLGGARRLIAAGPEQVDAQARALLAADVPSEPGTAAPVLLLVVDGATLLEGRPCPLRDLLAGRGSTAGVGGVVLTDRLPALCTATLSVTPDGGGRLQRHTVAEAVPELLVTGVPEALARRVARALARFEDPELRADGAGLPERITLLPLLGLPDIGGGAVADRWHTGAAALRARAVLGVTESEVFEIDLDDDGPHGLIAGTTGSGKSELLRTLIAALAMGNDPDHLTFALVDYKGGGALDECARLPHSVGLVTDLDEQLGERALRCLEAELRHREHMLRAAGLSHVRDYQRLRDTEQPGLEPMPRLVVVIDEFATLVRALPTFVDSLVSIAQRGRSLGMHLIMATQRPAGAVSDAIKNNVKLRIALRLESAGDSSDVIDSPAAAGIGSRQWGRGFYRLSAREVLPIQTALSTGVTRDVRAAAAVTITSFTAVPAREAGTGEEGDTDLQRLVEAAGQAAELGGHSPPRRPWPEPLPELVRFEDLAPDAARGLTGASATLPAYALADDPDHQSQYPVGWDPAAGNLLVFGAAGAGATTALAALALAGARAAPPDRLHIFVLDFGPGELAPLCELPHVGAYVGAAERERQARLVRMLRAEVDARRASGVTPATPDWLVLLDNTGAFLADHDKDAAGMALIDDLQRVFADGPAVGVRLAASADRSGAVPGTWSALTQQKLLLRLADPGEYGFFDVPRGAVPAALPGRALVAATRQVLQIAWPGPDLAAAVTPIAAAWPDSPGTAPEVGLLPSSVLVAELAVQARLGTDTWWLPVGLGDAGLRPVGLELYEHEHALIAGPARSGRSTVLCAIAEAARTAPNPPAILALAVRRSPLRESPAIDLVAASLTELCDNLPAFAAAPLLLLVDDADAVDDTTGALEALMAQNAAAHVVAAGRSDLVRRAYGHWTTKLRESRAGVLLIPDHDLDGDILGVQLPRLERMAPLPGRGYLVLSGTVDGVQTARPRPVSQDPASPSQGPVSRIPGTAEGSARCLGSETETHRLTRRT